MKRTSKILAAVLVIAMVFALAVPALAAPAGFTVADDIVKIDKKGYDGFIGKEYTSNNSSWNLGEGVTLVSDNKTKNAECWYFDVAEGAKGTIEVAYKISNNYFVASFIFDGAGKFYIGDAKGSNGVNMVKVGPYDDGNIIITPDPVKINLGFIGYYIYDGKVMSTSIHWQYLVNEGDMIDWDAVDAAYDAWVAQGGLKPDRELWQTSGFASFTFDDYAELGYGDFNLGQIESFYKAYYVDPGYVLPDDDDFDTINAYYAVCQLYNDLMWGNDTYGLQEVYTLTGDESAAMHLVGLAHRDALQDWRGVDREDTDVRYIPVSHGAVEFYAKWTGPIRDCLEEACKRLGINIDDFIAAYDTAGFLTRNNLW